MTLELRYAVSRPGRKQLGLVGVQFEAVGRHPLTDVGDARLQLSRCSSDERRLHEGSADTAVYRRRTSAA